MTMTMVKMGEEMEQEEAGVQGEEVQGEAGVQEEQEVAASQEGGEVQQRVVAEVEVQEGLEVGMHPGELRPNADQR